MLESSLRFRCGRDVFYVVEGETILYHVALSKRRYHSSSDLSRAELVASFRLCTLQCYAHLRFIHRIRRFSRPRRKGSRGREGVRQDRVVCNVSRTELWLWDQTYPRAWRLEVRFGLAKFLEFG